MKVQETPFGEDGLFWLHEIVAVQFKSVYSIGYRARYL